MESLRIPIGLSITINVLSLVLSVKDVEGKFESDK